MGGCWEAAASIASGLCATATRKTGKTEIIQPSPPLQVHFPDDLSLTARAPRDCPMTSDVAPALASPNGSTCGPGGGGGDSEAGQPGPGSDGALGGRVPSPASPEQLQNEAPPAGQPPAGKQARDGRQQLQHQQLKTLAADRPASAASCYTAAFEPSVGASVAELFESIKCSDVLQRLKAQGYSDNVSQASVWGRKVALLGPWLAQEGRLATWTHQEWLPREVSLPTRLPPPRLVQRACLEVHQHQHQNKKVSYESTIKWIRRHDLAKIDRWAPARQPLPTRL